METLTLLLIMLASSYFLSECARKLSLPRVLGPLTVGLALGFDSIYIMFLGKGDLDVLRSFSELGLAFLMFYVGLELDFRSMMRNTKQGLYVSAFNVVIPFTATFAAMMLLGYSPLVAVITGFIICVTAEAMSVDILKEANLLKSRLGQTIMIAATFDDLIEVLFIAGLVAYVDGAQNPGQGVLLIFFHVLIFLTAIYTTRIVILPWLLRFLDKQQSGSRLFVVGVLMVLLVSVIANYLDFGLLIGAFMAGIIVKYTLIDAHEYHEQREMKDLFEATTFGFLAPFFFIWIGMNTDISLIFRTPVLGIILIILAFGTKIAGSVIGNWLARGTVRDGITIGVATANKGIVEVVAAEIAWSSHLITAELFSAIICMTIATSVLSPIVFRMLVRTSTS